MKNVLRLEKNGKGPYRGDDGGGWQLGGSNPISVDLEIYDKFKAKHRVSPLFGFKNWKQAKTWFCDKKENEILYEKGFRWKWFKVRAAIENNRQVMFLKIK